MSNAEEKLRLNLGCGKDIKPGYTNVDFYDMAAAAEFGSAVPCMRCDLSVFPWPFKDKSASEILMLDFLEHFEYSKTRTILQEVWRVLEPDGFVDIQVPDFTECAKAMLHQAPYNCNVCGYMFTETDGYLCVCYAAKNEIAEDAMKRLYGGQNHKGNYHYTAFTKSSLEQLLHGLGFYKFQFFERNENNETYQQNWNFKVRAYRKANLWQL